jgi:hypothetical protein
LTPSSIENFVHISRASDNKLIKKKEHIMPAREQLDMEKLTQLCERLAEIDLFGKAPPAPPWGSKAPE